jgi:hypothetical protein
METVKTTTQFGLRTLQVVSDVLVAIGLMIVTFNVSAMVWIWVVSGFNYYYIYMIGAGVASILFFVVYVVLVFFRLLAYMSDVRARYAETVRGTLNLIATILGVLNIVVHLAIFLVLLLLYVLDVFGLALAPFRFTELLIFTILEGILMVGFAIVTLLDIISFVDLWAY